MVSLNTPFHPLTLRAAAVTAMTLALIGCESPAEADLDLLDRSITSLKQVVQEQTEVLDALQEENVALKKELDVLQADVADNTGRITSNTSSISTNHTQGTTNANDIGANTA